MKDLKIGLKEVITFWFEELTEKDWWVKSDELDSIIASRFGELHKIAKQGKLKSVRNNAEARLAELIILDQFSRNIFRNKPNAFACDELAIILAQEAVVLGEDLKVPPIKRQFYYMPYMHSESLEIHDEAVKLFEALGLKNSLMFEQKHRDIIVRFGRYPHRNKILGRESNQEELNFLLEPGSSF